MTDDRYELPLFDPPEPVTRPQPDAGRRAREQPVPGAAPRPDEPMVVERLDLEATREWGRPPVRPQPAGPQSAGPQSAGIGPRLAAGIIDLTVHLALVGVLIGGSAMLGVELAARHWPAVGLVTLLFSFLYHVVPLAFWGHTPGMSVAGLRARTRDDQPLSMPQATRRWMALLLTVATVGLGVLLALGGRSLADRLSDSQTLLAS